MILSPLPLLYELHPEDPLEFYTVSIECCIAGLTRIMFGLLRKMRRKMMVAEAFDLLFPVTLELDGVS